MLARSVFRRAAAQRAFVAPRAAPVIRRSFTAISKQEHAEVIQADKVPVITYTSGEKQEVELSVDPNAETTPGPVSPPGQDVEKRAFGLDRSLIGRLTPTLQKFTLPGKVAVVTG